METKLDLSKPIRKKKDALGLAKALVPIAITYKEGDGLND